MSVAEEAITSDLPDFVRRELTAALASLDRVSKALDPQPRHILWETLDHARDWISDELMNDAVNFAECEDRPEDHLDDDTFDEWERAGSPEDVAAWLAQRS